MSPCAHTPLPHPYKHIQTLPQHINIHLLPLPTNFKFLCCFSWTQFILKWNPDVGKTTLSTMLENYLYDAPIYTHTPLSHPKNTHLQTPHQLTHSHSCTQPNQHKPQSYCGLFYVAFHPAISSESKTLMSVKRH